MPSLPFHGSFQAEIDSQPSQQAGGALRRWENRHAFPRTQEGQACVSLQWLELHVPDFSPSGLQPASVYVHSGCKAFCRLPSFSPRSPQGLSPQGSLQATITCSASVCLKIQLSKHTAPAPAPIPGLLPCSSAFSLESRNQSKKGTLRPLRPDWNEPQHLPPALIPESPQGD